MIFIYKQIYRCVCLVLLHSQIYVYISFKSIYICRIRPVFIVSYIIILV